MNLDSLQLKNVKDIFLDDYGNIYLYKNHDLSFTKYDSLGNQKGKLIFTVPFKIQSVQNSLNIPIFSENSQELKFLDQNLSEIQTINFNQKFGFIKAVFVEDLHYVWLIDESTKSLIHYNFREDKIINSFPFQRDFNRLKDFLIFENQVYLLFENELIVQDLKGNLLFTSTIDNARKISRENERILLFKNSSIIELREKKELSTVFFKQNSTIVDKNQSSFLVLIHDKLYLYQHINNEF